LKAYLDDPSSDAIYYVLIRAMGKFKKQYNYYPGASDNLETDVTKLRACTVELLNELNQTVDYVQDDLIEEM